MKFAWARPLLFFCVVASCSCADSINSIKPAHYADSIAAEAAENNACEEWKGSYQNSKKVAQKVHERIFDSYIDYYLINCNFDPGAIPVLSKPARDGGTDFSFHCEKGFDQVKFHCDGKDAYFGLRMQDGGSGETHLVENGCTVHSFPAFDFPPGPVLVYFQCH